MCLCFLLHQQHVCCTDSTHRLLSILFPLILLSANLHQVCRTSRVRRASAARRCHPIPPSFSCQSQCGGILVSNVVFLWCFSLIFFRSSTQWWGQRKSNRLFAPAQLVVPLWPELFLPIVFVLVHGNKTVVWLLPAAFTCMALAWDYKPTCHHNFGPFSLERDGFQIHYQPAASWD